MVTYYFKTETGPYACQCGAKAEITVYCDDESSFDRENPSEHQKLVTGCMNCFNEWYRLPPQINAPMGYLDKEIEAKLMSIWFG